jgi:hypothetical protein
MNFHVGKFKVHMKSEFEQTWNEFSLKLLLSSFLHCSLSKLREYLEYLESTNRYD